MNFTQLWAKRAFFNFTLLALAGVLLRYKILFSLPVVDQKHLLHAHSHFAFAGWVSLALFVAIIHLLKPNEQQQKQFNRVLWAQQLSSYGMLCTFPFMGYAAPSIFFSTLSILVSFWFAAVAWKIIGTNNRLSFEKKFLYAALFCNVISAAGTFTLAYLMANKIINQDLYFGSVYFYLHFQYNGWFLFTIFALFFSQIKQCMQAQHIRLANVFFYLLLITLIPAWFLSMLWMRVPGWMSATGSIAAVLQVIALVIFIRLLVLVRQQFRLIFHPPVHLLWFIALLAFSLKIIMQGFSAIPALNQYAFGIRPIVIGFLHLVLLGFVSMFIIGYLLQNRLVFLPTKIAFGGLWLFVSAMFLNELVLMSQGLAAIFYKPFPFSNELLLLAAGCMFTGLLLFYREQTSKYASYNTGTQSISR
ncbi:MAG TPA: hypothetical protein VL946_04820 [Lacibacter sp.]|jgi:hypothetical protein|nr:hypothetical protein [Lacibacter sp.]